MLQQQLPQRSDVPRDDGLDRLLEAVHALVPLDRVRECLEVGPVLEAVLARDDEPGVIEVERRGSHVAHGLAAEPRMLPLEAPLDGLVAGFESGEQRFRLPLVRLHGGAVGQLS